MLRKYTAIYFSFWVIVALVTLDPCTVLTGSVVLYGFTLLIWIIVKGFRVGVPKLADFLEKPVPCRNQVPCVPPPPPAEPPPPTKQQIRRKVMDEYHEDLRFAEMMPDDEGKTSARTAAEKKLRDRIAKLIRGGTHE